MYEHLDAHSRARIPLRMCFSATASFSLSAVLATVGGASIARAETPRTRLFAAIPLLFAAQQAVEGIVWVTIAVPPSETTLHRLAVMSFLALALVIWPLWAPTSLWLLEKNAHRRKVISAFFALGIVIAAVAGTLLLRWQPVASIVANSIDYKHATMGNVIPEWVLLFAYSVPTVGSFFASTRPMVPKIGFLLFASLVIAAMVKHAALTSVWCFFAAALSVLIFVAVTRIHGARSISFATTGSPKGAG